MTRKSALLHAGLVVVGCVTSWDSSMAATRRGVCTRNIATVCAINRHGAQQTYMNSGCALWAGARRILHRGECKGKAGCKGAPWCLNPDVVFPPVE